MTNFDIPGQRLRNQHLLDQIYQEPGDIMRYLGAVQAQDYPGAKWSLGMRLRGSTDASIERAFTEGAILRTHVLRPTWHFVTPDDIRWLLSLTAPRVNAANTYYYRQLELDDALFAASNAVLARAVEGGKHLTRPELATALERSGISGDTLRLSYIMMRAELDAVICSGPRRGNQFTYALLDERAPNARKMDRDEALTELTKRYFSSRGPATIQDFAWWSGLTISDMKAGLEMSKADLASETTGDKTYWLSRQQADNSTPTDLSQSAYLLPKYDEYGIAYKDRKDITEPAYNRREEGSKLSVVPMMPQVAVGGKISGGWKRTLKKNEVLVETSLYRALTAAESAGLRREVERYGRFIGLPASLESVE